MTTFRMILSAIAMIVVYVLGGHLLGNAILDSASAEGVSASHPLPKWATRPCAQEDSVNCYWDAGSRGNGSGHSFLVRRVPGKAGMVCVFYVDQDYARTHDYCS